MNRMGYRKNGSTHVARRQSSAVARRGARLGAIVGLALLLCGSAGPAGSVEHGIAAVPVISGLAAPVLVTAPVDNPRLFIVERAGTIRILEDGALLPTPFLDISDLTDPTMGERGLLGLAFPPDHPTSGLFYVNYTAASGHPEAGVALGDTVIDRFGVGADPDVADPGSRTTILRVSQPAGNHNGGTLAFGDDGMLWIAMGDGGGPAARPNSQDGSTLLGKMLRIDVSGPTEPMKNYGIPSDNPFVAPGDPLDEIWAFGFRNPFRWSFDRQTGDLYIGDVGQQSREEVDVEPADDPGGRNYGWPCKEGTLDFQPADCSPGATLTPPVHEYENSDLACAVTGGVVYRGDEIPWLRGQYFFADFCADTIWSFVWDGAGGIVDFRDRTVELTPPGGATIGSIVGFGEDGFGEIYIVDLGGEVFKIVPANLGFFAGEN